MSIKQLIHQATSLVFKDETPSSHPAFNLPPASAGFGTAAPAAPSGSPFAVPNTTVLDEKVYQTVLAKTNFNTTTVGKAILKYYDALEGVIADQNARFKAAIQQAQKLDNITPDQVLATFDQLWAALNSDAQGFQRLADGVQANQITARQTKVARFHLLLESINNQIAQLNTELASETANHANAVQQYGLAQSRRAQEIAAQKAQVASLLQ